MLYDFQIAEMVLKFSHITYIGNVCPEVPSYVTDRAEIWPEDHKESESFRPLEEELKCSYLQALQTLASWRGCQ